MCSSDIISGILHLPRQAGISPVNPLTYPQREITEQHLLGTRLQFPYSHPFLRIADCHKRAGQLPDDIDIRGVIDLILDIMPELMIHHGPELVIIQLRKECQSKNQIPLRTAVQISQCRPDKHRRLHTVAHIHPAYR